MWTTPTGCIPKKAWREVASARKKKERKKRKKKK